LRRRERICRLMRGGKNNGEVKNNREELIVGEGGILRLRVKIVKENKR
jgi:hypothetical protein